MNTENKNISSEKKSSAQLHREYISVVADKIQSLITNEKFAPSDIMILLQRRNPFAAPLVKELKSRNLEVAGNDRIVLPKFPAIRDLLNLVRFCLDTTDDYSLCCVLKSPLYRLNERDIFNICSLKNKANKELKLSKDNASVTCVFGVLKDVQPDIFNELTTIVQQSKRQAPYSFFMGLLNTNSNREKMISALGTQIIDPLEEFLTICLAYERTQPGTLHHFLKWFITGGSEIKRDMDASAGIRVVTVHGSKGLESPVVFLVDTVRTPKDKPEKIFSIESNISKQTSDQTMDIKNLDFWLWSPGKFDSEMMKLASESATKTKIEEYYRLLYVAMTRARDRLYIYGLSSYKTAPEISWHSQLMQILSNMPGIENDDGILRISNDQ